MLTSTQAGIAATLGLLAIFSAISLRKKLLNLTGVVLADIIGLAVFMFRGFTPVMTIFIFYFVAETATMFARKHSEKHERRTTSNIIGNLGPALIALFLGQGTAFFGAVSAALADTISSEIGMLSKRKPV